MDPVFTLDADLSAVQARAVLGSVPPDCVVVIRRAWPDAREGHLWYAVPVEELRDLLTNVPDEQSLGVALDLHEHGAQDAREVTSKDVKSDRWTGIVLDGGRAVGFARASRSVTRGGLFPAGGDPPPAPGPAPAPAPAPPAPPPPTDLPGDGAADAAEEPAAVGADEPEVADVATIDAYPRLEVPAEVLPGTAFDVVVGLSALPPPGLSPTQAPQLRLVAPDPTLDLVVQVLADRFDAPDGIRRTLTIVRATPDSATVTIPLVAPATLPTAASRDSGSWRGVVEVELSAGGVLVGRVWRDVVVTTKAVAGAPAQSVTGGHLAVSTIDSPAADLTVSIIEGAEPGRLMWTFTTPHDVPLPEGQVVSSLPIANAMSFALGQIKDVGSADGTAVAENRIKGLSRAIADATPVELWSVLTAVWAQVKAGAASTDAAAGPKKKTTTKSKAKKATTKVSAPTPSLLLISSDAYVPWELASVEADWVVDRSLVDEAAPQVLGAQVRMGRWLPAGPRTPSGLQRPSVPPATAIEVERMALVVGDYQSESGLRPLPEAMEEGKKLNATYPSVWVKGTLDEVDRLLDAALTDKGKKVAVQVVHVACHGEVDAAHPAYNGIVLSDTALRMDPTIVRGSELGRASAPLVFLNACQLAQSSGDLLCDYGGMAGAFLSEGCRAFVAPLWSVDDGLAYDTAVEFYRLCLGEHITVGEAMRQLRGRFTEIAGHVQTTPLAYVFYGHPDLQLSLSA